MNTDHTLRIADPLHEGADAASDLPRGGNGLHVAEIAVAQEPVHEATNEFSIDELRVIAASLGVPHHAQITDRDRLVDAIRRRL